MAVSITTQNITDVNNMYVALFGRAPDGVGLGYWARQLAGNDNVAPKSLANVANEMFATDAARTYYPSALTNEQIVKNFYLNVLGREADAAGAAYWTAALNKVGATPGTVIVDIVASVTNWKPSGLAADAVTDAAGTKSKALFENKVEVSTYFGNTNGSIAAAQVALSGVTEVKATVTAAKTAIDTNSAASGTTFTLTTGIDTISGTANNDTINANADTAAASATINNTDIINGGAGTDTLSIRVTDMATGTSVAPTISAIEVLTIDNDEATAKEYLILSTSGATGITNINSSGSVAGSQTFVTSVAASAVIGMTNTKGQMAVDFASTVFATSSDAITVNLNGAGDTASGGTAAALWLDGVYSAGTAAGTSDNTLETLTITSNTTASRIDMLGGSAVKTLNISGNANLTLTDTEDSFAAVTTVSASTFTGALDINVASSTANIAITTNSGDDRINIGAIGTNLTADDTLTLGAGTDIVAVSDTNFDAADITIIKSRLTSAEVLELNGTLSSATYNFADINIISTLRFSGTNAGASGAGAGSAGSGGTGGSVLALTGLESGDTVTFTANTTGGGGGSNSAVTGGVAGAGGVALTVTNAIDGGSDSITIALTGGVTIAGGAGGTLNDGGASSSGITGAGGVAISAATVEVINIVSTGTSANTIAGGAAGVTGASGMTVGSAGSSIVINANGTINVSGTRDINIGTIGGTNASVDASTFTGKLTVTGEAGNNTIKGGSAVDTINGGAGIDTLTGNAGADVFRFKLGANGTDSESNFQSIGTPGTATITLLNTDSITDYVKGSDAISILLSTGSAATISAADILTNGTASVGAAAISSAGIASFVAADDLLGERIFAVEAAINAGGAAAAEQFAVFEHSTNTYLFVSDGTDGMTDGDILVKLTGVTGITSINYSSGNIVLS